MAPDGVCTVEVVPIPVGRPVTKIRGTIDDLVRATPPPRVINSFVRAELTDPGVVLDAKRRLTAVYPHVVEIVLDPPIVDVGGRAAVDRRTMSATEAADLFWLASVGGEPSADERDLLHRAIRTAEEASA